MPSKQTAVRIKDPSLLDECAELLQAQIGERLPNATIINAALVALKNQHLHRLITESDCQTWTLKASVATCAEVITLLMDCGLCEKADYEVEGLPGKGVRVLKDGKPLSGEQPESNPARPDWVDTLLETPAKKKQVVN